VVTPLQMPPLLRFGLYKDLRDVLGASLKCVGLIGCHKGRGVASPVSRRAFKVYVFGREWQRDLDCVVIVQAGRFTSEADPKASTAPEQNTPGCR